MWLSLLTPGRRGLRLTDGVLGAAVVLLSAELTTAQPALDLILTVEDLVPTATGEFLADGLTSPAPGGMPTVDPTETNPVFGTLRRLIAAGEAQGFTGIVYENRDRGHSRLPYTDFPTLTWLRYDDELRERGLDFGLAGSVRTNLVTFGNSSTALTRSPLWRSQVRQAMTTRGLAGRMFETYDNDQLYVYPEHRDHDDVDHYPANWPYTITSQGSSGSDRDFLKAIALTLASFRPETFQRLREYHLIAPTVQMIMRRELTPVIREEHYFTGRAHPVVFRGADLRPGRMVARAAALAAEAIPPMVRIQVEHESFSNAAGLAGMSEKLFDTPSAIARVWRDTAGRKSMTVTTAGTVDPNGRDLTFSWRVLSGKPEKVRITPLDDKGLRARLEIEWHDPWTQRSQARTEKPRLISRVDIGVFAHNGVEVSAPAMISINFPAHQKRNYQDRVHDAPRLISIDYDAVRRGVYFDPILFWSAPWIDRLTNGVLERRTLGEDWLVPPNGTYQIDRSEPARPTLNLNN